MNNVEDVIVFGKPNPLKGQAVNAIIKTKNPLSVSDFKLEMRKFCGIHLERFKITVKFFFSRKTTF